jgi:hypothetical protein
MGRGKRRNPPPVPAGLSIGGRIAGIAGNSHQGTGLFRAGLIPGRTGRNPGGFTRKSIEVDDLGYTVWQGVSKNNAAETSTLVEKDGKVNGIIHFGNRIFGIEPDGKAGEHVLIERDLSGKRDCGN